MTPNFSITANKTPLSFMKGASWGEPVMTTRRRGGSWELSWKMDFKQGWRHTDLARNSKIVARIGSRIEWVGTLTEPDMDSMEFVAQGHCRQAETALALDFVGGLTSDPSVALFYSGARGLTNWGGLTPLPPVVTAGPMDTPVTIAALLDAMADEQGKNWVVDVDWGVRTIADPTKPKWMVTPGAGVLGVADDDYWTNLVGTYLDTTGAYARVYSTQADPPVGRRERAVDLSRFGWITAGRAQSVLDAMLAKGLARTGWTNGISVARGQLFTLGGTTAAVSSVRGGDMVHLAGLVDERGATQYTNIVADEVVWNIAEDTAQINPVGLAPRDLSSVIESMGGQLL